MGSTAPGNRSTREEIPVVALRLFLEKGYAATSMRAIAEELGITKPALYYHFDSKEDIVASLVADAVGQVAALVDWAREQPLDAAMRHEVLSRWADIVQAHGLMVFRFLLANREVAQEIEGTQREMIPHLRELFTILTPPDAGVDEMLRIRLALLSVNLAGVIGPGLDAPDDDVLAASRRLAADLMP